MIEVEKIAGLVVIRQISRFFGMVSVMLDNDHEPPHFHARYGPALGRAVAIKVLKPG